MRVTDLMFAFPDILLAILIVGTAGEEPVQRVPGAGAGWLAGDGAPGPEPGPGAAGEGVRRGGARPGGSDTRIYLRHLLPNLVGPVVVAATVGMGAIVLAESTLASWDSGSRSRSRPGVR